MLTVLVGFTVMVAVPVLLESCEEVAVMVTCKVAFVPGAVNTPDELIEPALADQLTAELKLPVPLTEAVHWLVWFGCNVVGLQDTVTDVMLEDPPPPPLLLPPPPPQAAIIRKLESIVARPSIRT